MSNLIQVGITLYLHFHEQKDSQLTLRSKHQANMNLREETYTSELESAVKNSRWDDKLSKNDINYRVAVKENGKLINLNEFPLKHTCSCLFEFQSMLYYFFVTPDCNGKRTKQFSITISSFTKKGGENKTTVLEGFKGVAECINADILIDNTTLTSKNKPQTRMVILVGLKEGFIKTIELIYQNQKFKTVVFSKKVENKPIISVTMIEKRYFKGKNICLLLIEDSKVFIYNYLIKQVIIIYQPATLSHDFAVMLTLHLSRSYFATCTKSGQIFFWEINKQGAEAIDKSQNRVSISTQKGRKFLSQQDEISEQTWEFSPKHRIICVFPMYVMHSATIDGLLWISFFGNLLSLITRTGVFKIIAINFQIRDQFLNLIEYQIERGQSIKTAYLDVEKETLMVFKASSWQNMVDKNQQQAENMKNRQSNLKKNDYQSNINANSYKQLEGISEIEALKFGGEMKVEYIEKIDPLVNNKTLKRFNYAIMNQTAEFLLLGNNEKYFIGFCPEII